MLTVTVERTMMASTVLFYDSESLNIPYLFMFNMSPLHRSQHTPSSVSPPGTDAERCQHRWTRAEDPHTHEGRYV